MIWLFTIPFLLVVASAVLHLPYDALRMAARNAHRGDGARSPARTRRELRHGSKLAWRVLGAPLFVLVLATGGMRVFHLYAMPDSTLADLFGDNHPEVALNAPDLEAWADAIDENGRMEDYERWRQAQGFDPLVKPTLYQQLAEHWPIHLVFLLLAGVFALWYAFRITPRTATSYRDGTFARAREYLHRDLKASLD